MPYYHIRIKTKSKPNRTEVALDLSIEKLMKRYIAPYRNGQPLLINGRTISPNDLERLQVSSTEKDSVYLRNIVQNERSRNIASGYLDIVGPSNNERIAGKGRDVTDDFITGPPGYGKDERFTTIPRSQSSTSMRVFISHSSFDIEVVKLIVELLRKALNLESNDIRCTSLDGYRMPGGVPVDQRLRAEVHDSELLIGVITPASLKSAYVMFELGARWGAERPMIPLLASGTTAEDLEGPLDKINALNGSQTGQLHQLVEEAAGHLSVDLDKPSSYANTIEELTRVSAISLDSEQPSPNDCTAGLSEDAKELLLEAAKDTHGTIFFVETFGRSGIETNSREFGEYRNPRSQARWKKALDELLGLGLVETRGAEGNVFEVSGDGYEVVDKITDEE